MEAVANLAPWRRFDGYVVLTVLALGVMLRLIYFQDMPYRADERWTFEKTQAVGKEESFPWKGMRTSAGVHHPGGSIWVFLGLAWTTGAATPDQLGLACQVLNSLALVLLAVFILRCVPGEQREAWLWALALASFNPIHVMLHRKIWPPSITPFFVMLFVLAWWYRRRTLGAFFWGVMGLLLGQIHPAGFFLAAGFFLWALLFERSSILWRWWLPGSVLASLPMIPWVLYLAGEMQSGPVGARSVGQLVLPKFFVRWLTEPLGFTGRPNIGADLYDMLRYPLVLGQPTFLVALAHLVMTGAGVLLLARGAWWLWRERRRWSDMLRGRESSTAFLTVSALWGFGLVFTCTLLPIHHHYMVLAFPFMFLWLARLALASNHLGGPRWLDGRVLLLALCVTHFVLSLNYLGYIHVNAATLQGGGYGTPYAAQAPTP